MKKSVILLEVCFLMLSAVVCIVAWSFSAPATPVDSKSQRRFASEEDFINAFKNGRQTRSYSTNDWMSSSGELRAVPLLSAGEAPNHSETNVQVEGVDEADIVKCDGSFIYTISGPTVNIIAAYPAEEAAVVSRIDFEEGSHPQGLFIEGDRLAIIGSGGDRQVEGNDSTFEPYLPIAFIRIYDIAGRDNPLLLRTIEYEGAYLTSRKIAGNLHIILASYPYDLPQDSEKLHWQDIVPSYRNFEGDGQGSGFSPACHWNEIEYTESDGFASFVSVVSVSLKDDAGSLNKKVITASSNNVYASLENLYITNTEDPYNYYWGDSGKEWTNIYKFKLEGSTTVFSGSAKVPGTVLNQFSMDESAGYFRIATTYRHSDPHIPSPTNNVYILDADLNVTGQLEDLARGEEIHSARFMGNRGYLVTFKKTDPFFVLDLSNPQNPRVLGALKIPGYSDYLHPYDDNHIIGVGKNTVEANSSERNFAWYQGMKIAIFDVSDVANPKEMCKVDIGDRGTDSYVLNDHKAFLFDREKGLLVLPVLLAEITGEQKASGDTKANTYGQYTYQGAYVYDVSLQDGIKLKGRVTHIEDQPQLQRNYYCYGSTDAIKRCGYIEDNLYTVSGSKLLFNSLADLNEVSRIELSSEQ